DGGGTQPPPDALPPTGGLHALLPAPTDTRFYAGVDLHARSLFLSIPDRDGQECFARNLTAAPPPFLKAVQPFRDGRLVCGSKCGRCCSWSAHTCREHAIAFVLGHAWAMKALEATRRLSGDGESTQAGAAQHASNWRALGRSVGKAFPWERITFL